MALSSPVWAYAVDKIAGALLSTSAARSTTGRAAVKCPRCGSWAEVQTERAQEDNTVLRRYICGENHRFTTIEYADHMRPTRRITPDRANKSRSED